jgi:hypothetical protein
MNLKILATQTWQTEKQAKEQREQLAEQNTIDMAYRLLWNLISSDFRKFMTIETLRDIPIGIQMQYLVFEVRHTYFIINWPEAAPILMEVETKDGSSKIMEFKVATYYSKGHGWNWTGEQVDTFLAVLGFAFEMYPKIQECLNKAEAKSAWT